MFKTKFVFGMLGLALASSVALAGVIDPDCTPEKAAKSAAMKATIGVDGRCKPKETIKDSTKRAVGADDKGPIEKRRDDNDKD
jgi:hypothetical protein